MMGLASNEMVLFIRRVLYFTAGRSSRKTAFDINWQEKLCTTFNNESVAGSSNTDGCKNKRISYQDRWKKEQNPCTAIKKIAFWMSYKLFNNSTISCWYTWILSDNKFCHRDLLFSDSPHNQRLIQKVHLLGSLWKLFVNHTWMCWYVDLVKLFLKQ